jgi:ribose 5-phosphate isomerase A
MDLKKEAARVAYTFITNNTSIGLGDGVTVRWLAGYLKDGMNTGLNISIYTSSQQTQEFLQAEGITVLDISKADTLDQYFDGCDQIDGNLNALKSGAGIHTLEKLLASMAKKFIILADASKFVSKLESKFPLVLEVLPQATCFVLKEIQSLYQEASLSIRSSPDNADRPVLTRNGNYLINCRFSAWPEPEIIQDQCKKITGVVEISLFYKMVSEAIITGNHGILRYERKNNLVSIRQLPYESID